MEARPGVRKHLPAVIGSLAVVAMIGLFVALGGWQLQRAEEKRALLEQFARAEDLGVVSEPRDEQEAERYRYRKLRLRGAYVSSQQLFLDSMIHEGQVGYQVLTPFRPADGGDWLLVNRGWIRAHPDRSILPNVDVAEHLRAVEGRIAPFPEPGLRLGVSGGTGRTLLFPTIGELQSRIAAPIRGYQLLLDPDQPDGFIREWRPVTMPPERHVAYAVQWYAGAALLAAIVTFIAVRAWRGRVRS